MEARQWIYSDESARWTLTSHQAKRPFRTEFDSSRELEAELRKSVRGEVRFDDGSRALYATDGSNYRQTPIGVVIPRDVEDVIETIRICRKWDAPILSRGGGTSLAGQCCNIAVILDFSKYMNKVLEIDPVKRVARVQPGVILDDLRHQAEKMNLTFGPDPSTHTHCTLGGMIGNNSCGVHAMMAGRTSDNVIELDILTYDGERMKVGATSPDELEEIIRAGGRKGEIYSRLKALRDQYAELIRTRYPKIPRRVSGYNLDNLLPENGFQVAQALTGSEGTLVTILEATVRLVPARLKRTLVVLGYDDVYAAGDHVPEIRLFKPIALEGLDEELINNEKKKTLNPEALPMLPEGKGWLMVEFGADHKIEADAQAQAMMAALKVLPNAPSMKIFEDKNEEKRLWEIREAGLGATARVPGQKDTWEGWEDSAVPTNKVGEYLRELRKLFNKYEYACALYGHFGQGCIHTRIDFDLLTEPGIKKYRSFMEEASSLVLRLGGSLSGEHGDGQSRAELLPKMFGHELVEAFREYKSIWDPGWKMNPGKIVDPYRIDENLRLGTSYSPPTVKTHFKFPEDKGSLPYATLRCVGVGKCRRMEGGTMCPSFMATREEKHSTRGRAHLLHEMLTGETLKGGWKSDAVKEALDLCLSCKGCKGECPVNVDIATYKAEFLSHYYQGRMRPRSAYAMGLIDFWARIGSRFPALTNFVTQTPGLSAIAKAAAGMAQERKIPKFANQTFKDWFAKRGTKNPQAPKVILWPDTFNNHFHPESAKAAVRVLEAAGFQVVVPQVHLCCGRPLYDYGMLDLAKTYLHRVIDALRDDIRAGVPVVGLEPSCVAVFRDEMHQLIPTDQDAGRLRDQTFMLSEFLEKKAPDFQVPKVRKKAIVQGHCHHKSILGFKCEKSVLSKMELEHEVLESGCCGMAGSFGFEKEAGRYEVSQKVGERVLLPAVRRADPDTLIIADGFSCRTQIEQGTRRKTHHLAEVLALGLGHGLKTTKKSEDTMSPLYDVSENFNSALAHARKERGEPDSGIARAAYDTRLWLRLNSRKTIRAGLLIAAVSIGAAVLLYRRSEESARQPSEPAAGHEAA